MNYLVAVLPDRIQAEKAYSTLEKEGLPTNQIDILGKGYKSADEYGFIEPNQQAKKGATHLTLLQHKQIVKVKSANKPIAKSQPLYSTKPPTGERTRDTTGDRAA